MIRKFLSNPENYALALIIILFVALITAIIGAFIDADITTANPIPAPGITNLGEIGRSSLYRFNEGDTVCYIVLGGTGAAIDCLE